MNEGLYLLLTTTFAPYYGWFFAGAAMYEAGKAKASSEAPMLRLMLAIVLAVSAIYFLAKN